MRQENELPESIDSWGWKFHHLGTPTKKKRPGERYLEKYKMYVSGFPTSPFGIEWMRFEKNCPIDPLIQSIPHLAFEVENLDQELRKHNLEILSEPESSSQGIRVAMIKHDGAPIELIEFEK
jgi:hypothetical protein